MKHLINPISKEIERLESLGLFSGLLYDHSTNQELEATGLCYRFYKSIGIQKARSKALGEVATPSWLCSNMNDEIERLHEGSWQDYITSAILEITCGEAPFLVSRYDAVTGEFIPIEERIGLLDRKLRVAKENSTDSEWIYKAFESVYGYDIDPSNVVIARMNLLLTFEDYLDHKPTLEEYERIINIITWNIIWMNGLTYLVPGTETPAVIYDWKEKEIIEFRDLGK